MSVQDLNAAVTLAIFKAEHASAEAARLWKDVAACEAALYAELPKGTLESDIAKRGIASANLSAEGAMAFRRETSKHVVGTRYPVAQLLAELAEGNALTELAQDVDIPEESFKQALRDLALDLG